MRRDNDNWVLLLIEQYRFHTPGNFTHLRAVLEVICEADRAWSASEKEEGVCVVLVCIVVDLKRAEHDVGDGPFFIVRADRRKSSLSPPNTDCALRITCDHAWTIGTEGYDLNWRLV